MEISKIRTAQRAEDAPGLGHDDIYQHLSARTCVKMRTRVGSPKKGHPGFWITISAYERLLIGKNAAQSAAARAR
jgi:hypothetical protein